jgi:hypothetical protein
VSAELKSREKRRSPRRSYNDGAWIRVEGSFGSYRRCQLLDLSRTGAMLALANALTVPNTLIFLASKQSPGCPARVKWRRGSQIAIEFLRPSSSKDTLLKPDNQQRG